MPKGMEVDRYPTFRVLFSRLFVGLFVCLFLRFLRNATDFGDKCYCHRLTFNSIQIHFKGLEPKRLICIFDQHEVLVPK